MDTELGELLATLGRSYWVHQYRIDRNGPKVLAAVRNWDGCSDMAVLHSDAVAYACRTPSGSGEDVLDPEKVHWQIAGMPARVLRELLALPAPGEKGAPTGLSPVMVGYGLPAAQRTPSMRVRRRGR